MNRFVQSFARPGAAAGLAVSALAAGARADIVDLTTAMTGSINGTLFHRADFQPAGTGFIDSFVRVQTNAPIVHGYNTSGRPAPFHANNSPNFTRNIIYADIPTVSFGGIDYKEFILDINQTAANPLLSLDKVQVYTSPTGSQTTTDVASLGTLRYDLDFGQDSFVRLDYRINSGSGQGDMVMLIPIAAFAGTAATDFLYLYSLFGQNHANNDGYEEWALRGGGNVIPLPPAAWIAMSGLGLVWLRHATRRR
ncbi:MAG: hypothetical protein WD749_11795 [Phycisphaerales bacterium]